MMKTYQHEFIDFAIGAGVLRFGEFTLKSGRTSPCLLYTSDAADDSIRV